MPLVPQTPATPGAVVASQECGKLFFLEPPGWWSHALVRKLPHCPVQHVIAHGRPFRAGCFIYCGAMWWLSLRLCSRWQITTVHGPRRLFPDIQYGKKINLYFCFDPMVIIVCVLFWHVSKIQSKNSFLRWGAIREMECYSLFFFFQPSQKMWGKPPLLCLMPTFSHDVNFHQTFSMKQFIAYLCYKSLSISKACLHSSVT